MNYADIVRLKFPQYILTKVGTGNTYEELEWSVFNPAPNPIPKSTLDQEIQNLLAAGVVGAVGDVSTDNQVELVAFTQLPNATGLVKKIGNYLYTLDTNNYLTSINSSQVTTALGYVPYDSANPNNYATKSYVDSIHSASTTWLVPVHAFNFVGTASAPPSVVHENENYIISNGGNIGAWSSFSVGDRVSWVNSQWVLREPAHIGCRLGVCFDNTTTGVGDALGKDDYIGEIVGGDAINGWQWTWTAPAENYAVFNNLQSSVKFGEAYTYEGTTLMWVPFASNTGVAAGNGLTYTGSALGVVVGKGIEIVSNKVSGKVYPSGGLILTTDGTTSSTADAASFALEPVGTAGTYRSVNVDLYGRVISGSNPTTLAGYNILDAQPLDADLTAIANISATTGLLRKTAANTWSLDTNSYITGNQLITVSGDVSGTGTTAISLTLANTGVSAGTYNTATTITPFTVDAKGRITNAGSALTISPLVSSLQQSGATVGQVIQWNGSAWAPTSVSSTAVNLDSLTDVTITNPLDGQMITYNGSQWVNIGSTGGTPGSIVKRVWSGNVSPLFGTTRVTPGTTAPPSTAGTQIWSITITPTTANLAYIVQTSVAASCTVNNSYISLSLYRDNVYLGGTLQVTNSSTNSATLSFAITDNPGVNTPVTYQVRIGSTAGTWYVNRRSSEITYGGLNTGWTITEY